LSGFNLLCKSILRVPRSQRRKNRKGGKSKSLESLNIARLRTNTAEFAQLVRGSFSDLNTAAVTAQSYSVFLNYPSWKVNASSTIGQCSSLTGLLANEQKVFDEYKVTKLVVRYLPWVTNQVRVSSAVAFTAPTSPLLIMGTDLDDAGLWVTRSKAMSAQNRSLFNRYYGGMHTVTMRQHDPVDRQKWLNLGAFTPSSSSPPDPNNPSKLAAVKIFVDGYQLMNTT